MSILLEGTRREQAPPAAQQEQGEPVLLSPRIGAGQLVAYHVRPGQRVGHYHRLATVLDGDELPVDVLAPRPGVVVALALQAGQRFASEAIIAYLVSDAPCAAAPL